MSQFAIAVGEVAPYLAVFFFMFYLVIKSLKISRRASRQGDIKTQVIIYSLYVIMLFNLNVVCWFIFNAVVILKFDFAHFVPLEENPIKGLFHQ